jgi:hypothetical protein
VDLSELIVHGAQSTAFPEVSQDYLVQARQMSALSLAVHIPLVTFGERLLQSTRGAE